MDRHQRTVLYSLLVIDFKTVKYSAQFAINLARGGITPPMDEKTLQGKKLATTILRNHEECCKVKHDSLIYERKLKDREVQKQKEANPFYDIFPW